jgi:hypothetical protein
MNVKPVGHDGMQTDVSLLYTVNFVKELESLEQGEKQALVVTSSSVPLVQMGSTTLDAMRSAHVELIVGHWKVIIKNGTC